MLAEQPAQLAAADPQLFGEGFDARLGAALGELLGSAQTRARMAESYAKLGLPPAEKTTENLVDALESMTA